MSKRLIWHKQEIQEVLELLLSQKTTEDLELIFDSILTPREINDIARRYKALKMLEENASYADIKMKTGMSSVTIARLSVKCGYGFRKSVEIKEKKTPKNRDYIGYRTIKYKGIPVFRIKK